jgi:N-formylglutamate amidohydrolase
MKHAIVISLPHCSNRLPPEYRSRLALSDTEILDSTDLGTKEIFGRLPGAFVMAATWSRLLVDLNRGGEELGERGVVPSLDYMGRTVFQDGAIPDSAHIRSLVELYHRPFHDRLEKMLGHYSIKALFDCHSLNGIGPAGAPDPGKRRKDITLGNNGNANGGKAETLGEITCPAEKLHATKEVFEKKGFTVSLNKPYSGGFITKHYGPPLVKKGGIAVQIEINEDLFLGKGHRNLAKGKVKDTKERIEAVFEGILQVLENTNAQ